MDQLEDLARRTAKVQNGRDPTRAKPEPWFVGSGTKLMAAVLCACAVLTVARVATTLSLAEDAWRWWHRPPSIRLSSAPAPAHDERPVAPARDPALANARLTGNPGQFFGPDSYPAAAIRAGEQGRTVTALDIDNTGTPVGCTILSSSGSRVLDAATCSIALGKVRYSPARNAHGTPIRSRSTLPVRWVLPT